jgi:hypothetical protein
MRFTIQQGKMNNVILPDWLGSGHDLFGTIQIMKGKNITRGFLEIDFDFKFSETFNYPIVFAIKSTNSDVEAYGVAFIIDREIDPAQRAIEENIIVPKVCSSLRHNDFIEFFADVIEKDVDFALYLNKTPKKFRSIKIFKLTEQQKIVLDERLAFAIAEILDKRKV